MDSKDEEWLSNGDHGRKKFGTLRLLEKNGGLRGLCICTLADLQPVDAAGLPVTPGRAEKESGKRKF